MFLWGKVDVDKRIIALDDKGNEHIANLKDFFIGDIVQLTASFSNLPFKQIKQFRFEARPYKWVEFRNVSLTRAKDGRASCLAQSKCKFR